MPRPPRPTLFPYTTLFRSVLGSRTDGEPSFLPGAGIFPLTARQPVLDRCPDCDSGHLRAGRSEEHTSELQSHHDLVCRLLLEKKKEGASNKDGEPLADHEA